MARAKSKPKGIGRKVAPAKKVVPVKPAAPTYTREELIEQMRELLDGADAILATAGHSVTWGYPTGALTEARERCNLLFNQMARLPAVEDAEGEYESPQEIFEKALHAEPGTVPSLARPGTFIEWIGYIPVLVEWGGFLKRSADLRCVDPKLKWISATGYRSTHVAYVDGGSNPSAIVRGILTSAMAQKEFTLHDVEKWGTQAANEALAANEWLRNALAKGPVDSLPLPRKYFAVQRPLFA